MIRKPDAGDFRESSTVAAIRDAGTLAREGARGVGEGTASFLRTGLMLLFGFGFLMSVVIHLGPFSLLVLGAGVVAIVVLRAQGRSRRAAQDLAGRWSEPAAVPVRGEMPPMAPVQHDLSVGAAGRAAARIAVPAILFFPTSSLLSFMLPFTIGAIVALALAFLILARLAGDRMILRYDAETVTVRGLLGEATMLCADVADVTVRKAAWWDLRVRFTSGSRRNLAVLGRGNRLGGSDTLYIPIDLLGLDAPALARLVTRLLAVRGGSAAPGVAGAPAPRRAPERAPAADGGTFDPDAIMARYLAERDALVATQRPDPLPVRRPVFGRKVA